MYPYVNLKKIAGVHAAITVLMLITYFMISAAILSSGNDQPSRWVISAAVIGGFCFVMSFDNRQREMIRNTFFIATGAFLCSISVMGSAPVRNFGLAVPLLVWLLLSLRTSLIEPLLLEARDEKYDGIFSVENGVAKTGVFCVGAVQIVVIWLTVSLSYFFSKAGL